MTDLRETTLFVMHVLWANVFTELDARHKYLRFPLFALRYLSELDYYSETL